MASWSQRNGVVLGKGVDLSGYNVREMAADIDAIRQALGYDKIILFGGSFGSHHGLAVLRYYEEHIQRAVLSGVEGSNHTIKLPSTVQHHIEKLNAIVKTELVSGTLDARTPVSNAEEVLKDLANRQHLVLENISHSHGDLGEEHMQQFLHAVTQFLKGKPLPTTRIVNPFQFDPIAP